MKKRSLKVALLTVALLLVTCLVYANEKCKECHADIVAKHAATLHGKAGKSCDACHGGVDAHLASGNKKDIFTFGKGDVKKQNAQCLACHTANQKLMFWDNSQHKKEDVACVSCHSIHKSPKPAAQEPEVCFGCHKDVRSQANKISHHPIIEGKVKCSDCHNPHGTLGHGMINAENLNQLCYKCHAEKRGPYVWGHAVVEEDCMKCHTPHGSKTSKLLTERLPNLCQNCHDASHGQTPYDNTQTFGGLGASQKRAVARNCLNCHSQIHGSNNQGIAGRQFRK
jgi:DmsE family decaheme c-type cytochrome